MMKHVFYLLILSLLFSQSTFAQPCNDTLKVTALETSPCTKTDLQLYANTIAGATYLWTGPDNFYSALQNPKRQNLNILQGGNYIVNAATANCIYTDTITIQLKNAPNQATIYLEQPVCDEDSGFISAFSSGATDGMYIIDAFNNVHYPLITVKVKMINGGVYKAYEISTDRCVGDTGYYVATGLPPRPASPTITLGKPACEADSLILNVQSPDTGVAYKVYAPWGKEISWLIPYVKTIHTGKYKAVAVNNIGCVSDTAILGVAVAKPQIPGVAIYGNADTGPFGKVTFTSYVTKAGNNPVYTWIKNGTLIPGATGYTYTAVNGTDIVPGDEISLQVLADATNCPGTGTSNTLIISENLLINNSNIYEEFSIYPNPANGIFTIVSNANMQQPCSISLVNGIGQAVYTCTATGSHMNINATSLPAGIYTLILKSGNNCHHQKMVISY